MLRNIHIPYSLAESLYYAPISLLPLGTNSNIKYRQFHHARIPRTPPLVLPSPSGMVMAVS